MTQTLPPPFPALIPETAPFSPEQRAWLNGFFAGMVSLDGAGVTALSPEQSAALMPSAPGAQGSADNDDGEAPWHDQTLALAERMTLAEGRPLRRRMMAAMAQQDCGQCGYNCEDYSNAIFSKTEERLNLCVPGGKETARMLQIPVRGVRQAVTGGKRATATPRAAPATAAPAAAPGRSRDCPAEGGLPLAHAAQQARAPRRRPGMSRSTSAAAASTTRSATRSASSPPTTQAWPTPSCGRSARRPIFPSAAAPCARS